MRMMAAFDVNEQGFLLDPKVWSDEIGTELARGDELDLSDEHWLVIHFIRSYYLEFGIAPSVRKLCLRTGVSGDRLYKLFPNGPAKSACKIAGLPNADGCL